MMRSYVDSLRKKLSEQQKVYDSFKVKTTDIVCYKGVDDAVYGRQDANYTNRLRLSYYLLYEKVDDEDVIVRLFEEELKDRETNSFQGIGTTLQILTSLLGRYNSNHQYDALFRRAKNSNFDCACGYDANYVISDNIYSNDLMDCIYLCMDMDYKDVMECLVAQWTRDISEWDDESRMELIRYNSFLEKEAENEALYQEQLTSAFTKKTSDIIYAYVKLIQCELQLKKYDLAYTNLNAVIQTTNYKEIRTCRLFGDVLEVAFEIICCNGTDQAQDLWQWAKTELLQRGFMMYGNLYKKAIQAAKTMEDPYAAQLEQEWKLE